MDSDTYYISLLNNSLKYKQSTKNIAFKKLQFLQKMLPNKTIHQMIHSPDEVYAKINEYITQNNQSNSTKMQFIKAICNFIVSSNLNNTPIHKQWQQMTTKAYQPIKDFYDSNAPSEKQKDAYVSYAEVIKKIDTLENGSYEKLLLMFYSLIPPARADYWRVEVLKDEKDTQENYVLINGQKQQVVLNNYKTHKIYGQIILPLPNAIVKEIELSYKKNPRSHLFMPVKKIEPFKSRTAFVSWANKHLKSIFNKKGMNITMMRHIYITHHKLDTMTRKEKSELSTLMGHSIDTQDRYSWKHWLTRK